MNREWIDRYNEIIEELDRLKARVESLEGDQPPPVKPCGFAPCAVNPVEPKPEGWIE